MGDAHWCLECRRVLFRSPGLSLSGLALDCPDVVDACVPLKASPLRLRSGRSRPWNYFRGKFTLFRTTLSRSSRDRSERAVTIPSLSADGIPLLPLWYGRPLPVPWYIHRSEEHTSELQSLMRTSYAVFFLK